MKILLGFFTLLIGIIGVIFVGWNIEALFSIGPRTFLAGWLELTPLVLLAPITLLSLLFLLTQLHLAAKLLPFTIGILAILAGLGIRWFWAENPYFGFYYHKKELDQVVGLIESGAITPDQDGYAKLPDQYSDLSLVHSVLVSDTLNGSTYYFVIGTDDFDPSTWGYLYRPDGSEPPAIGMCRKWGPIQPSAPYWYACFYGPYDRQKLLAARETP